MFTPRRHNPAFRISSGSLFVLGLAARSLLVLLMAHLSSASSVTSFSTVSVSAARSESLPANTLSWDFSFPPVTSQPSTVSTSATPTTLATPSQTFSAGFEPPGSRVSPLFVAFVSIAGLGVLCVVVGCGLHYWRRRKQRGLPPSARYRQSVGITGPPGPLHMGSRPGSRIEAAVTSRGMPVFVACHGVIVRRLKSTVVQSLRHECAPQPILFEVPRSR